MKERTDPVILDAADQERVNRFLESVRKKEQDKVLTVRTIGLAILVVILVSVLVDK